MKGTQAMPLENARLNCRAVLGDQTVDAMARARTFLQERKTSQLLELVGTTVEALAAGNTAPDKRFFPVSYGGGKPCGDDLLAGQGSFYVTESGKVMLDCTGGHYQMTWGYNHPELMAALADALDLGIVWDNHSNIPSRPVKMMAEKLAALAGDRFDRVLLGVATGSVACGAALKIMLARYFDDAERRALGPPVILALEGNYHGTDMVLQTMRGMWPGLLARMETVQLEPNDVAALRDAFRQFGRRIAGFWAEPIMMNREAIAVEPAYLQSACDLCREHDALAVMDEIQTCCWYPEIFYFRRLGIEPDMIVVGKGLTAGFHPLSALLFRKDLDILAQYDAVSTNGNASLAAHLGLCNLRLIEGERARLESLAQHHYEGWSDLAAAFGDLIEGVNGAGLLTGLKFRSREDALGCHGAAVERGLWLRAHTYHPGHRTILAKPALAATAEVIDFTLEVMRELLRRRPWR